MGRQCNSNIDRAIAVADYILENGGHTVGETAKEFRCSLTTIRRDLNFLGSYAFYEPRLDAQTAKQLKLKYVKVKKTLAKN